MLAATWSPSSSRSGLGSAFRDLLRRSVTHPKQLFSRILGMTPGIHPECEGIQFAALEDRLEFALVPYLRDTYGLEKRILYSEFRHGRLSSGIPYSQGRLYYSLVRALKPTVVVETGVGSGVSTAFILQGLADNRLGHLYSVDLPGVSQLPGVRQRDRGIVPAPLPNLPIGLDTGWLVPPDLRDRWTLRVGDSATVLPSLTGKLDIQMFIHDSLHTYDQMTLEYELAWSAIDRGVLISDDVDWNGAFSDFSRRKKVIPLEFDSRDVGGGLVGILRKGIEENSVCTRRPLASRREVAPA